MQAKPDILEIHFLLRSQYAGTWHLSEIITIWSLYLRTIFFITSPSKYLFITYHRILNYFRHESVSEHARIGVYNINKNSWVMQSSVFNSQTRELSTRMADKLIVPASSIVLARAGATCCSELFYWRECVGGPFFTALLLVWRLVTHCASSVGVIGWVYNANNSHIFHLCYPLSELLLNNCFKMRFDVWNRFLAE